MRCKNEEKERNEKLCFHFARIKFVCILFSLAWHDIIKVEALFENLHTNVRPTTTIKVKEGNTLVKRKVLFLSSWTPVGFNDFVLKNEKMS